MVIRPPRVKYTLQDLGSKSTVVHPFYAQRHDFSARNAKGQSIECSFWELKSLSKCELAQPFCTVVYCHGQSGSRVEAMSLWPRVSAAGMQMLSFDFSGCGKSSGEYVTLGANEMDDLRTVLRQLQAKFNIDQVVLWGRSMGAVTILKHLQSHSDQPDQPQVLFCVLDSPYLSLQALVMQQSKQLRMPEFLGKLALQYIEYQVKKRADFTIGQVDMLPVAKTLDHRVLFVASDKDRLTPYEHTHRLFSAYHGQLKDILLIHETHSQPRNQATQQEILRHITCQVQSIRRKRTESQNSIYYKEIFHSYIVPFEGDLSTPQKSAVYKTLLSQCSSDKHVMTASPPHKMVHCARPKLIGKDQAEGLSAINKSAFIKRSISISRIKTVGNIPDLPTPGHYISVNGLFPRGPISRITDFVLPPNYP